MMSMDETSDSGRWWHGSGRSAVLVLSSFAGGLALLYEVLEQGPAGHWRELDIAFGAAACLSLFWRHRAPVAVALFLAGAASICASAGVANMVALYFVARSRSLGVAVAMAAVNIAAGCLFWLIYPGNEGISLTLTVNVAIAAAVTAWGALLQSNGALVDAYRERAERAEEKEALREENIRVTERTRIAREMHDVVAHRLSLVALYAGGLEVAPKHGLSDVRSAAALIRSSAVSALDELRIAIGVLREDEPRSLAQSGFDRLDDLVQEARAAGQDVDLQIDADIDCTAATAVGRDVYRVVQEGLTNARKHAPGEPVRVALTRTQDEVVVQVANHQVERSLGVPGSGSGLIGLMERATLAGGTLTHGLVATGEFVVEARLPWR